jgi:hypothetical protein
MVDQRACAKSERLYKEADKLRDELADQFDIFIDDRNREWRVDQKDNFFSPKKRDHGRRLPFRKRPKPLRITTRFKNWLNARILRGPTEIFLPPMTFTINCCFETFFWMTEIGSGPWGMLVSRRKCMFVRRYHFRGRGTRGCVHAAGAGFAQNEPMLRKCRCHS